MDSTNKGSLKPEAHTENAEAAKTWNETIPDLKNLRSYAQIKLALADMLRIIRQDLIVLGREEAENQYRELMTKLAEDRFTLAVLGQFKRGKSSLMNAIIGHELLPTGVLPLTSAITILKYGPAQRLIVNRENSLYPEEKPVSELENYVTEKGNPHNQKKVKTVYLEQPEPFLRYGIEFVDTPGVGSSIIANTETTYHFLPECDAVLFVTSADTPMTNVELQFLEKIKEYVNKIFFIVNKIDLVTDKERDEIIKFVTETIRTEIGEDVVKLFPLSSKLGLEGRISDNAVLYEQSGLKVLEDELASFLTKEKSSAFLAAVAQKAIRILENEADQNVFTEIVLQARAIAIEKEKIHSYHYDPYKAALEVRKIKGRLEALYNSILNKKLDETRNFELPDLTESEKERPEVKSNQTSSAAESKEMPTDLQTRGCPVCEYLAEEAFDFFVHWQYQLSSNEQAQIEFANELGFCPLHTWQLVSISSPQGASIGYSRLAEQMAHQLKTDDHLHNGNELRKLIHNSTNCRVCKLLRQAEEKYTQQLIKKINETEGQKSYRLSQGTCLWHLSMLIDDAVSDETRDFLLTHATQLFEQDAEDMRSFALKHEALRRALQNQNEKDAYRRTIVRIVGERRVCMPWAEDGEI